MNFEISTDASESGCAATNVLTPSGGFWSTHDEANHIEFLEFLAIKYALANYREMWKKCKCIRVKSNNTIPTAYVNNMGGIASNLCNHLAREICIASKVWLTAGHIPRKENITADFMSRLQNENTEWRQSPAICRKILSVFYYKPEIDLFASSLKYQIPKYVS